MLRGPYETFPAAGARNVPLNSPVRVRYGGNSLPQDIDEARSLFSLVSCGPCGMRCTLDNGTPVPFEVQVQGQEATLIPNRLAPGTQYFGEARGIDNPLGIVFCTSSFDDFDRFPPEVGTIDNIQTTFFNESCKHPMGGYRVGFQIDSIRDEDLSSVELVMHVTRADGVTDRTLVNRTRADTPSNMSLGFEVDKNFGDDPACFEIEAIDGVGNASDPIQTCYDPYQGVQFKPLCSFNNKGSLGHKGNKPIHTVYLALIACFMLVLVQIRRSQ